MHFSNASGRQEHTWTHGHGMHGQWGRRLTALLVAGPCTVLGEPLNCTLPTRILESHQQHNDLCPPLQPGRCKGEPLLSAHDETSVFSPLAKEIIFICAQARGICPLSYFCLYHLNIQYSLYASVLVKVSEEGPLRAQDLMSLAY